MKESQEKIKCQGCGISVPDPLEDESLEALLCNRCYLTSEVLKYGDENTIGYSINSKQYHSDCVAESDLTRRCLDESVFPVHANHPDWHDESVSVCCVCGKEIT